MCCSCRRGGFLRIVVVSSKQETKAGHGFHIIRRQARESVFPEPTIRPPSSRIFRHRRHLSAGRRAASLQSPRPCARTLGREDTIPRMTINDWRYSADQLTGRYTRLLPMSM